MVEVKGSLAELRSKSEAPCPERKPPFHDAATPTPFT